MTAPLAQFRSAQIAAIPALARTAALVRSDITAELIYKIIRLWTGHGPMQPQVWMHRYGEQFYTDVTLAQIEAATVAALTIDPILEEQGFTGNEDAMVEPTSLAGVDGTGRDVLGLVYAAALPLAAGLDADAPPEHTHQLWVAAGRVLQLAAHTAVLDTSRVAKGIQITGRDRAGWVRMVRPPCCARCAILAGKIGGATVGFRRHPNCDCDAVPVHDYENRADDPTLKDWVFDTREYFDSLSAKQQNKIFTVSGAQAIRDGAEPAQVINARRGMTTAKDRFGTTRRVTYESTTSRGWASRYLRQQYDAKLVKRGGRYRQTSRPRLMPEEIYEMAGGDRDKALVLLHKNGYLEGTSARLSGLGVRDAEVISAQRRAVRRLEKRGAPKSALLNAPRVIHRKAPATVIDTGPATVSASAGTGGGAGRSGPSASAAAWSGHTNSGTDGSGGNGNPPGGPPGPPRVMGFQGADDGENQKRLKAQLKADLPRIQRTVPVRHVMVGNARGGTIRGAHAPSRIAWAQQKVADGANPGPEGKTFFPELKTGDEGLREWLGDERSGLVQQILEDPDYVVEMDRAWGRRVVAVVEDPEGNVLEVAIQLAPASEASSYIEKVTSIFPISGNGVRMLDETGTLTYIDLREGAILRDEHSYRRTPGGS